MINNTNPRGPDKHIIIDLLHVLLKNVCTFLVHTHMLITHILYMLYTFLVHTYAHYIYIIYVIYI